MAVLGLRFCARAFSSCSKQRPLFIAVCGPLIIAASLVAEHRLQTQRLSNCGSWAQLLRGMWDLPRPELEPVSPALAGRFSTTAPPGQPLALLLKKYIYPLVSLFYLIELVSTCRITLNNCSVTGHLCLVSDFNENVYCFSIKLNAGSQTDIDIFNHFRKVSTYCQFTASLPRMDIEFYQMPSQYLLER